MMKHEAPDAILQRLQKLKKLQEGAESIGSLAEAENAAKRIQELLMKYNLSISDIDSDDEGTKILNEILTSDDLGWRKTESRFIPSLAHIISKHYFCSCVTGTAGKQLNRITFFGNKVNIETTTYVVLQMINKIREIAKVKYKEPQNQALYPNRNTFLRGFLMGAVSGLSEKLEEQRREQESANVGAGALIKRTDIILQDAMNAYFGQGGLKRPKNSKLSAGNAMGQGREVGRNMSINQGVGGSNSSSRLLN